MSNTRFLLGDFGIASKVEDAQLIDICTGDPKYMDPMFHNDSQVTKSQAELFLTDIYSLGLILFEMVTCSFLSQKLRILKIIPKRQMNSEILYL